MSCGNFHLGDYQKTAIERFSSRCRDQHGIVLLHRMGSGKTITATLMMKNFPDKGKNPRTGKIETIRRIVVCPESIFQNWSLNASDFKMIWPNIEDRKELCAEWDVGSKKSKARYVKDDSKDCASMFIRVGYNSLREAVEGRDHDIMELFENSIVTFDEVHNLAKMYRLLEGESMKFLEQMLLRTRKLILMTGTPVENNFSDLTFLVNFAAYGAVFKNGEIEEHDFTFPSTSDELIERYGMITSHNYAKGWYAAVPLVAQCTFGFLFSSATAGWIPAGTTGLNELGSAFAGAMWPTPANLLTFARTLALWGVGGAATTPFLAGTLAVVNATAVLKLAMFAVTAATDAYHNNPILIDTERLTNDIKQYVSFFDYEYYDVKQDKSGLLALTNEDMKEADSSKDLEPESIYGSISSYIPRLWGGEDTYLIRQWFPTYKLSQTKIDYTDFQSMLVLGFSARLLDPTQKRAINFDTKRETQEKEETWERYKCCIGNVSPECAFYDAVEYGERTRPLENYFVYRRNKYDLQGGSSTFGVPSSLYLQGGAGKKMKSGAAEKERMFSCPKFEEALELVLMYHDAARAKNEKLFLPVVYSNFDERGFRIFSAFLTACGFQHILLHGNDTDDQRVENLKLGGQTRYAPAAYRRRDVEEEFQLDQAIDDVQSIFTDKTKELAKAGAVAAEQAWEKYGPAVKDISNRLVHGASETGKFLGSTLSGAIGEGAVGLVTGAYHGGRRYFGLAGGDIGKLKKARPFGTRDSPVCVLLHKSIMEGASFTFNPSLIALEPITGIGPQEQVYARVLRRYPDDPTKAPPGVPIAPFPSVSARPVKQIHQLFSNFNQIKYAEAMFKLAAGKLSYLFPTTVSQAFKHTVSVNLGPDASRMNLNKNNSDAFDRMAEKLKSISDNSFCPLKTSMDGKKVQGCEIYICKDSPGSCSSTKDAPEDPSALVGGKNGRRTKSLSPLQNKKEKGKGKGEKKRIR